MANDFVMPRVILRVDSVQDQSVINNDGTKISFSLTVVECFTIFTDLVEKILPKSDIISEFFIDFSGINNPKRFIIEPNFNVVLGLTKNSENLFISFLNYFWVDLLKYVFKVLFSFNICSQ